MIYEEANYWETGYNFKLFKNTSLTKLFIVSHTNLDFKNGLIIQPTKILEDYIVSRSQYVACIEPDEFRGIYTKPYTGFQRGGQATTQHMINENEVNNVIESYYDEHYNRYNLEAHLTPHIENDPLMDSKLPHDAEPVDDESTAPPVKSGYKPTPKKAARP